MTTTWTVICKDCGVDVVYSEATRSGALDRGQAPPERCAACRARHRRETARFGLAYVDLEPGRPIPARGLKAGRLGRIERQARLHTSRRSEPEPIGDDEFGIKDEHVADLLEAMATHQVAIVQAGTGSGKSTFLPYRLMVPPAQYERDHLTRHGQIVVTQPRIDASTGIPEFVARRLHASAAGPGLDIGYRNSKATGKSDAANQLVYMTDGTLVNMIRRGELHSVAAIVIDEAHERSLNIDLILALLRLELRNHPHLRLLIVSATLERATFAGFFAPDYEVAFCPMPSKAIYPVHERWRAGPAIPFTGWPARMPEEAARTVHEVLRWMELGEHPTDVPDDVPGYPGDILCFLPGKRHIAQAIAKVQELLDEDEDLRDLAGKVELLPLHSELPNQQRRRPLDPGTRRRNTKYRVIVSTNLAETSLTIDGIRHVVDSGLNNLKTWDPATAAEEMHPAPHSRSGLLQRRGRAGRNAPGVWHCLFTREQFETLNYETPPEIVRAPLSAVLLNAAAGVTDPARLRWMPPGPSAAELTRVRAELLAIGAITVGGDPTEFGREINSSRGEFSDTTLLINADVAGCVVEAATMLAMKARSIGTGALLRWSRTWPPEAKVHVDDVHRALLDGCPDDVEVACRVVAFWEREPGGRERRGWCDRHYIDPDVLSDIIEERAKLLTGLQSKVRTETLRPIDLRLLPRLRAVVAWTQPNSVYATQADANQLRLIPVATARSDADVLAAMRDGPAPVVDTRSWANRQAPAHLVLLDRSRVTEWTSPLQPPRTVQQGSLCCAVDPGVLDGVTSLHALLTRIGPGPRITAPPLLPGDRLRIHAAPDGTRTYEVLDGIPDPTVDLGGGDPEDTAEVEEHSGPYGQVGGTDTTPHEDPPRYVSPWDEPEPPGRRPAPAPPRLPEIVPDTHGDHVARVIEVRGGHVIVRAEDDEADYERFKTANPAGSTTTAVLTEIRIFPRDRRPILIARDQRTGLPVIIDGAMLGTGLRFGQAAKLDPGTLIKLGVDGYDDQRLVRLLSQTSATFAALTGLRARAGEQRSLVVNAQVIDASESTLWVQVLPDDSSQLGPGHPPIVLSVSAGRLPNIDGLATGATARVRLSWGRRTSWTYHRPGLDDTVRLPDGPWELHADSLVVTAPPTAADWHRLVGHTNGFDDGDLAARLRSAVRSAGRRLLTPRAEIIDFDAIERMRVDGRTTATVLDASSGRVTVQLPHGGVLSVPAHALTWGTEPAPDYRPGDAVTAWITRADPASGEVRAELRDPAADPYLHLHAGTVVDATVRERTTSDDGFAVDLIGTPITAWLRDRDALDTAVGDHLPVRIVDVDPAKRRVNVSAYLFEEKVTIPAHLAEFWAPPPGQERPRLATLRRLLPDEVNIAGWATDDGGLDLRIRARDFGAGRAAVTSISGLRLLRVHHLAVPGYEPLRADDWAVLRRLAPAVIATTRVQRQNRTVRAIAVAVHDEQMLARVFTTVVELFPYQWVSGQFRYRREHLDAARTALREAGGAWIGIDRDEQLPRAVIAGGQEAVARALTVAQECGLTIPGGGSWRPDPQIHWTD